MIISVFSLFVCTVIEHWSCCPVSYGFPDSLMLRVTLSFSPLEKQVGLMGEHTKLYSPENQENADWKDLQLDSVPSSFTWYKVSQFSGVKRVSCVPINSSKFRVTVKVIVLYSNFSLSCVNEIHSYLELISWFYMDDWFFLNLSHNISNPK